jgi:hypothetical protein
MGKIHKAQYYKQGLISVALHFISSNFITTLTIHFISSCIAASRESKVFDINNGGEKNRFAFDEIPKSAS